LTARLSKDVCEKNTGGGAPPGKKKKKAKHHVITKVDLRGAGVDGHSSKSVKKKRGVRLKKRQLQQTAKRARKGKKNGGGTAIV